LANACSSHEEKLIIWTLLDTGLRVSELANLTKDNLDWQNHRLMIYGKGGIYGKLSSGIPFQSPVFRSAYRPEPCRKSSAMTAWQRQKYTSTFP
jgi:integrase